MANIKTNITDFASQGNLTQVGDTIFWDKSRPKNIAESEGDVNHVNRAGERLDLLASQTFGTPFLGWAIALRNEVRLWPNDLVPGKEIILPSSDALRLAKITK